MSVTPIKSRISFGGGAIRVPSAIKRSLTPPPPPSNTRAPLSTKRESLTPPPYRSNSSKAIAVTTGTDEFDETLPDADDVFSLASPSLKAARRRSSFLGSASRVKASSRDTLEEEQESNIPTKIARKLSPIPTARAHSSSTGQENETPFVANTAVSSGNKSASAATGLTKMSVSLLGGNPARRESGLLVNPARRESSGEQATRRRQKPLVQSLLCDFSQQFI